MNPWLWAPPLTLAAGFLFWRYVWFFRNPSRVPPPGENIVSPADGTVVYARLVEADQEVVTIKQGVRARLTDIVREDLVLPKLSIGIFMSPFNVHYNRLPLAGRVDAIKHHPPQPANLPMTAMHWRTMLHRPPFYRQARHLIQNERRVTRVESTYKGDRFPYYLVQIAGRRVNGIDSYLQVGDEAGKGQIFGMIRIGSQVDLILPYRPDLEVMVAPGDKVRAGESILVV
ncbi:MAG: phosphatidylserine decarboxylase [Thermodesulfobacteriota bacterium]